MPNVVVEAVGNPLPSPAYLQYFPAAENELLYSRDLTQGWDSDAGVSETYDQVGITGEPNTASLVSSTTANADVYQRVFPDSVIGDEYVLGVCLKKTVGTVPDCKLILRVADVKGAIFNTTTGIATPDTDYSVEVIDLGDWWKVLLQKTATGTACYVQIAPSVAGTGSVTIGNVEWYANKTIAEVRGLGPIFTTTAAVATDQTAYSFDLSNCNENSGAYYLDMRTDLPEIVADRQGALPFQGIITTKNDPSQWSL